MLNVMRGMFINSIRLEPAAFCPQLSGPDNHPRFTWYTFSLQAETYLIALVVHLEFHDIVKGASIVSKLTLH